MKVFLGGTCNESTWRDDLIPMLEINYFNPVVEDWTAKCMEREVHERRICDFVLYVITPKMTGVYSVAEVVDDSNKRPDKTIFVVLKVDDNQEFSISQQKSLMAVSGMIRRNGSNVFDTLEQVADYMNSAESDWSYWGWDE